MKRSAWVVSDGMLDTLYAKTTHALLRGSDRFQVTAVIDHVHAGRRVNQIVPLASERVPIYESFGDALTSATALPDCLIIGIATHGGYLPGHLRELVLAALEKGLDIVNGLHELLGEDLELSAAARHSNATIFDIRKAKCFRELHSWDGRIFDVKCPIIAVLGTDCAVGKRTTATRIAQALSERGQRAEMIYTGQSGWMLGFEYGFILDATPNDFVTGELEQAIFSCWSDRHPDFIFLEGQSALRNPSGPCGAEYLLSAQARAVILQHSVDRRHFVGTEEFGCEIPSVASEIELIRMYGAETIAIALNAAGVSVEEYEGIRRELESNLSLPVVDPFGCLDTLVDVVTKYSDSFQVKGAIQ